jgi:hypothetical protein
LVEVTAGSAEVIEHETAEVFNDTVALAGLPPKTDISSAAVATRALAVVMEPLRVIDASSIGPVGPGGRSHRSGCDSQEVSTVGYYDLSRLPNS